MRLSCWLRVVAVALGLVLISGILAGCGEMQKSKHEKALQQRYHDLAVRLCQGDFEGCVQFTNPEIVKAKGTEMMAGFYRVIGALVKLGKLTPEDLRIDAISFDEGFNHADMKTSHKLKGGWKSQNPLKWLRLDGQWYLTDK